MIRQEMVMLTVEELRAIKEEAREEAMSALRMPEARIPVDTFTSEEMDAMREQYAERAQEERVRREEMEWKLRLELVKVRDAELFARRAADDLRQIHARLQSVLGEGAESTLHEETLTGRPRVVPPPVPASAAGSSHRDAFTRAMAHRKRIHAV